MRGRKVSETDTGDAISHVTSFKYDRTGNLVEKTDKEGKTTYYTYDELNRLVTVVDPASEDTQYTYDIPAF